jgi:glycosyltransferase involved in cell wall biosynthesis
MLLSVVIPVYNEEATLARVVDRVAAVACDKQIIVIDDCSTDRTAQTIAELKTRYGSLLQALRHEKNRGKGAAIRTGLAAVRGDVIIIQDADLEYHPEDYPDALRLFQEGWADAVYGSRFSGAHRVFLYWHFLANKFLTFLVNFTCDSILGDMETGFKMIRADVFKSLDIQSFKFDVEVEITIKLLRGRYRVYEMPITYTGRGYDEGKKITWRDGFHALYAILKWSLLVRSGKTLPKPHEQNP